MASIQLKPPEHFDFSKPDEWPKWKKRFQQYGSASGLNAKGELRQVDTLLYCLGDEANSVLASANISKEDRKSMMLSWKSLMITLKSGGTRSSRGPSSTSGLGEKYPLNNISPSSTS